MNEENNIAPVNEELNVVEYGTENIRNLIYTIRGKQVMLDSDVAMLYHYETKNINKAMKRNIERFPEDFCFQLTKEEAENLKFQNGTSSLKEENYGGRRKLAYVYTEQGISMLSGLLKNEIAIQVSINIMRAFIEMRKFISTNANMFNRISNMEYQILEQGKSIKEQDKMIKEHSRKIEEVFDELQKNKEEEFKQQVFFNGQIYDSYSLIIDIIKTAQKKILIIDNYIDDTILKMLTKKNENVEAVILTSEKSNIK